MEQYHVDYVALCKSFYSPEGDMMVTSVTYEGLPPIAAEFDVTYWARGGDQHTEWFPGPGPSEL